MIILSATRAFKGYHFEVPHNLSKNAKNYWITTFLLTCPSAALITM